MAGKIRAFEGNWDEVSVTPRNDDLHNWLEGRFVYRADPTLSWVSAVSAGLFLPQLRAFWPMSSVSQLSQAADLSGQARTLSNNGAVTWGITGVIPHAVFVAASSQYLSRADEAALDGGTALTVGGWFEFDGLGAAAGLLSKWETTGNQRGYRIFKADNDTIAGSISVDGTLVDTITSAAITVAGWYFVALRFTASTELALFVSGVKTTAASSRATIFNNTGAFEIGRSAGGSYLDGSATLCFVAAAALPDLIINTFYWRTRAMFPPV